MNDEIIYFHVNDWFPEDNFPDKEPFRTWMDVHNFKTYLCNDEWCKQNKICVVTYPVDMSVSFNITAKKEWVKQNCPSILDEDKRFQVEPNEDGFRYGPYTENEFLEYKEENFGVHIEDEIY